MFDLRIPITAKSIDVIKADLRRTIPNIKSSHRAEAIARGLGFQTYASLLASCRSTNSNPGKADGGAFTAYLSRHGFAAPHIHFYRAVSRVAIEGVREKEFRLTLSGIGIGHPRRKDDRSWETVLEHGARFHKSRDDLLSDQGVEEFLRSMAFLALVPPTATIRPDTSSYRLKHIAEKYPCTYPEGDDLGPGYVANGAFISAAIHLGFRYRTFIDDLGYDYLNVTFNMPQKFLEDLDCKFRPDGARAQDRRRREEQRDWKRIGRVA